ncbi:phage tail domain-containing protein [Bacillus mycoides]|uniref:phage tail domain-containing protein n=1 Tax=Bacillus mycoides TaxID=1405 RepID=UPI0011AA20AF|nr:phage tail domain-containing protein [Bacillus mycoides]
MSLTIDGKTLNELGLALLPGHEHPAAPSTRDYTVTVPGMPGAYDFGADLEARPFTLPLLVKPQPEQYLLAPKIREIMKTFFDPYGKPKTVKLIFDYEPDKYYKVRYSGSLDTTRYKTMTNLVFPLTAFDPYAYSVVDTVDDVLWGDDIPFMSDIPLGVGDYSHEVTAPTTLQIENTGSLVVRPIITINGSASSMTLTANGKSFSVGGFPEGAFLLIDSQHYMVTRHGQNYLSKMTGDFLELMPGVNSIGITGTNLHFQISFEFNAKYM